MNALVKRKKHNESRSMLGSKHSMAGVLISFKLMRPGWIPATPLRNAGNGEETPVVIPCKHGQHIIVVHRCQPT